MSEKQIEIKEGIKAHLIKTDIFKTNLVCIMLTVPLKRETVTLNALIPFLLKRGTANLKDQSLINKKLEEMYGAEYDCGIDKIGDNQALKFYVESINDEYALEKEDLLKQSIELLLDIIFNPLMVDNNFKEEFIDTEKNNLRKMIEGKKDNKDFYAFNRCIENMYDDKGFGIYKYGYLEDLDKIDNKIISEYYNKLIKEAKIDIYISGDFNENNIKDLLLNINNIKKLESRPENIIINNSSTESKEKVEKIRQVEEKMNINQGKLVIGLDIMLKQDNIMYAGIIYNAILGDGANSMLFQNVREKAGLAYTTKSSYNKMKNNIFIRSGIEIQNFEKAVNLIKEQLENIKNGKFTEDDIRNAKNYIVSGIKSIEAEQDTEIVFYIGQELSKINYTVEEYIKRIEEVSKEDIIEIANNIQINLIYFLTGDIENDELEDNEE